MRKCNWYTNFWSLTYYKYSTNFSLPTNPAFLARHAYIRTHLYQISSSPWASALDHYVVSTLRSRVGWTTARRKERKIRKRQCTSTRRSSAFIMKLRNSFLETFGLWLVLKLVLLTVKYWAWCAGSYATDASSRRDRSETVLDRHMA